MAPRFDHFHAKIEDKGTNAVTEVEGGWTGGDNPNAYSIEELHTITCRWADVPEENYRLIAFALGG